MLTNKTRYLNFKPTDGFQLYADALMTRLLDLAPSDSATQAAIEKKGEYYFCKIAIVSMTGRFEALIESANPKSALEEARRRIIRQLSKWNKQRFLSPGFT